ncbi:MAG: hypothetical protein WD768_14190 [Phycisphaeraceae bacterium]
MKCFLLAFILTLVTAARALAGLEGITPADVAADIDWPMFDDPNLGEMKLFYTWDDRLRGIWSEALARPDVETRRRAIADIAKAHTAGMPGLASFTGELIKQMDEPGQHPLIVLAAAKALITLDAKDAAASFLKHNEAAGKLGVLRGSPVDRAKRNEEAGGIELVLLTDPALAKWKHAPADALWLARLEDAKTPRPVRASAIVALGHHKAAPAAPALRAIAIDTKTTTDSALRLAAAQALALIQVAGLEKDATALATGSIVDRLIAATLISKHGGADAVKLMQTLVADAEPAVATIAAERLLELSPKLLAPSAAKLLASSDPKLRLQAARSLVAEASPEGIAKLSPHLDDPSPAVRYYIRDQFIAFHKTEALREAVKTETDKQLSASGWRALEQASVITGRLDYEGNASRLVDLMSHDRSEVRLAAIVGLRRLAVKDDALLAKILDWTKRHSDQFLAERKRRQSDTTVPLVMDDQHDRQLAQALQLLGVMRYQPADAVMRRYIPKDSGFWVEGRCAALWALGYLHEGKPEAVLTRALEERLSDLDPNNPELVGVRRMSATSLGRMKADTKIKTLTVFYEMEILSLHIGGSCRWAIMHITGKALPPLPAREVSETGWFIQPIEAPAKVKE